MVISSGYSFPKRERIVSQKLADELFTSGQHRSLSAFPLRIVYLETASSSSISTPVQVLVIVPKKRLHHAVSRNRVKRQIREAWRHHRQQLTAVLPADKSLLLAFIWQTDELLPTQVVDAQISKLLDKLANRLTVTP